MHQQEPWTVSVVAGEARSLDVDLLVYPVFTGESVPESEGLAEATANEVTRAAADQEFRGKLYEWFVTPILDRTWTPRRAAMIGLGDREAWSARRLRQVGAAVGGAARRHQCRTVAVVWREPGVGASQGWIEGIGRARFEGDVYKRDPERHAPLDAVTVVAGEESDAERAAANRGRILADCSNLARRLVNEPANTLTPRELASRAAAMASETALEVEVLDEAAIRAQHMGLLLGVAQGSQEPPALIVLRHRPRGTARGATDGRSVLGLVGKGVTFDTGGISIKPAAGMEEMKGDMAGGAAVLAAMRAISLLDAPVPVIGVVPAAENMPGGRAIRPGDVLVAASGTTVEVLNTDAEGRLLLGDALWYARQQGATHLVDVATLTGHCVVALGHQASGLFGRPDSWRDLVARTAEAAGERLWPLPVFDEYKEQLKSDIADLANVGGRPAGASTAALFLREFAGDLPWAHLDVAGTAWATDEEPYRTRGATGVAVGTLVELAWTSEQWPNGS